ncbi:MAG: hypothetical protein ABI675_27795 [Chitinophagaceae bacterium]
MEIIERRGFKIRVNNNADKYLLLTNDNLSTAKGFMLDNGLRKAELNYVFGFTQESTDFFKDYSFVDDVAIIPAPNIDITGINHLKNLKRLRISHPHKQELDFMNFPLLEYASFDWNNKVKNLDKAINLKSLSIFKWKMEDFSFLSPLTNLEELKIVSSAIKDLGGLNTLVKLRTLELYINTKLTSLSGIDTVCATLTTLIIETCKQLNKIDEVSALQNLENLEVNNCGNIDSLKPITGLKKLKRIRFVESTNILDGDISPCIGRKLVAFQNRKNYTHTNEQIDRIR